MHTDHTSPSTSTTQASAGDTVLRIARMLHRAALADSLSASLPVLRRLLAAQVMSDLSLPELHRRRHEIRRKHVLRMLAAEAGFRSWEDYRPALEDMRPEQLAHFDHLRREVGYPNLWFSNFEEARDHAWETSSRVIRVGAQAVVLPRA